MRWSHRAAARTAGEFAVSLTEYVQRDFSLVDVTSPTPRRAARSPGARSSSG